MKRRPMKKETIFGRIVIFALIIFTFASGQQPGKISGAVQGKVIDDISGQEVAYANVMFFRLPDSTLVDGGISDEKGYFYVSGLPGGRYYGSVKFIGFHSYETELFRITPQEADVNLGEIRLKRATIQMSGVEVVGEKPQIEFKADKKVIHADQFAASQSGTAVEILENVPSVDVDVEGNVTLRGSGSFLVLIDGHPSVFSGGDALEQIPATVIQSIEIITNPSAKFDPDGTTGIINIITKKQLFDGISGQLSTNAGTGDKYGANAIFSVRTPKLTWNSNINRGDFQSGGQRFTNNTIFVNDTVFSFTGDGRGEMRRNNLSGQTSLDFYPGEGLTLSLQLNAGQRERGRTSRQTYTELPKNIVYQSLDENTRASEYISGTMSFTQKFAKTGHQLTGSAEYRINSGEEFNETTRRDTLGAIIDRTKNTENGDDADWRLKLDYVNPLNENRAFEAGLQSRLSYDKESTGLYEWSLAENQYIYYPEYSHANDYTHIIHSLYSIYKDRLGLFDWQIGLRGEYTYREMQLNTQDTTYLLDRWDYFPSIHVSMPFLDNEQIMASYSRRIERPRNWYLEPYPTARDAYSVWQGNPDLKPEYINALELSWQHTKGKNYLALDLYHRSTENKIERVQKALDATTMLYTFANVGKDFASGAELSINYAPAKFYTLFLSGNLFRYRVEGEFNDRVFDNQSTNWGLKANNSFFLKTDTRIQLDANYRGPSVNSQGRIEAFWIANLSAKQDFGKNWTASLQVRDLFKTAQREFTQSGPDFENTSVFKREAPIAIFALSYKFNNFSERKSRPSNDNNGDGGDDIFMF
jgi:outer membrane receptor protein involved in Fe transport